MNNQVDDRTADVQRFGYPTPSLGSTGSAPGYREETIPPPSYPSSSSAEQRQASSTEHESSDIIPGVKLLIWQSPSLTDSHVYSSDCPGSRSNPANGAGFKPSKSYPLPTAPANTTEGWTYSIKSTIVIGSLVGSTVPQLATFLYLPRSGLASRRDGDEEDEPWVTMLWSDNTVEIGGIKRAVYPVKSKIDGVETAGVETRLPGKKGIYSNDRIWTWGNDQLIFEQDPSGGTWTASHYDPLLLPPTKRSPNPIPSQTPSTKFHPPLHPLLSLSPYRKHPFKKDDMPFGTVHDRRRIGWEVGIVALVGCLWMEVRGDIKRRAPKPGYNLGGGGMAAC